MREENQIREKGGGGIESKFTEEYTPLDSLNVNCHRQILLTLSPFLKSLLEDKESDCLIFPDNNGQNYLSDECCLYRKVNKSLFTTSLHIALCLQFIHIIRQE